ncbi:Pr6Pr family membrane protein [Streptomyces sp. NBC_00102]|uniref:Pr6Pr family membrane protein n=1 Tax=Streptomyces sp. NBC_00102 TaxID=2975652 RepID=UPI002255C1CE|nr:Pr6Pr family membrane protein [Streptomyces sp. NBC_00102]MCX5398627.1 Pr6Pr family membrane protein [Streptomyces sp. NBC_00102]
MTAAPKTATLPRPRAEDAFLRGARTPRRTAAVLRALVCAAAISGLSIELATTGAPLELLSRFTFQANVLVAGVFGWSLVRSWTGRGPVSPNLTGGVLLVAVIIGLTYHLILTDHSFGYSAAGTPVAPATGPRAVSEHLLHTSLPVAVILDWLLLTPARTLRLRFLPQWVLGSLAYLAFVLARGTLLAPDDGPRYPYPFLNVDTYGYSEVLAHAFALSLLLVVLASVLIALDHVRPRPRHRTRPRR